MAAARIPVRDTFLKLRESYKMCVWKLHGAIPPPFVWIDNCYMLAEAPASGMHWFQDFCELLQKNWALRLKPSSLEILVPARDDQRIIFGYNCIGVQSALGSIERGPEGHDCEMCKWF